MKDLSPKIKIIVIATCVIFLLVGIFFGVPYLIKWDAQRKTYDVQKLVNKKNMNEILTEDEAAYLDKMIIEKQDQKIGKIQEKTPEEVNKQGGYLQEEVDYILSPHASAEKDLGIKQEEKIPTAYTQEEVDNILNPK